MKEKPHEKFTEESQNLYEIAIRAEMAKGKSLDDAVKEYLIQVGESGPEHIKPIKKAGRKIAASESKKQNKAAS